MASGAQGFDKVQAVKARYHPVDDQQIETVTQRASKAFGAIGHLGKQVAFFVKAMRDVISGLLVVLNKQNLQAAVRFLTISSQVWETKNVIFKMSSYKIPM